MCRPRREGCFEMTLFILLPAMQRNTLADSLTERGRSGIPPRALYRSPLRAINGRPTSQVRPEADQCIGEGTPTM